MAAVLKDGKTLKVAKDFVDAVSNNSIACRGVVEINSKSRFNYESTLSISETERTIREAARQDKVKITLLTAQLSN